MFKSIGVDLGRAGEFEQLASLLPPFARALPGHSLASVMSFSGIVCLGYFDLATVPASEVETGFADLIFARPLQRHWLVMHDQPMYVALHSLMSTHTEHERRHVEDWAQNPVQLCLFSGG
jgi:hypothetical protein